MIEISVGRGRNRRIRKGTAELCIGVLILMGYAGAWFNLPILELPPPDQIDVLARLSGSTEAHPLGTDHLGRDLQARLISAVPVSLGAALAAMAGIMAIAIPWGFAAALGGRRVDMVLMRLADMIMAFPTLVLALAVIGFMGASLKAAIIGVALAWWPSNARFIRALVLAARERDFVRAAWLGGASRWRVVYRHVVPQILPPLAVLISLESASVLLALSGLSFLGIGAQPPTAEWGAMLNEARPFFTEAPHMLLLPGMAVFLAVLAFNLIGEGLRDLFDTREPFRW